MGGKKDAKEFFQRHTNSARKICWGKKSFEKCAKTRFLYSHENRDQKMGGKERAKQFSRNTPIERAKNVRKKSS